MKKRLGILFLTTLFAAEKGIALTPWINEFHYDDAGGDNGEFVEIAVPSSFTDLASVSLTLYNGGDGKSYSTHALTTFSAGATDGGLTFYSKSITGIQNGAPDGMALSWPEGTQFISYEGSFLAANGPAVGLMSSDIGVAQADAGAPDGSSLGLMGLGDRYDDFLWSAIGTATPGSANFGQTVVPEPQTYALMVAGGLGLFVAARVRRRRAMGL